MPRVVHFEIHASDPQSLSAFYAEVFGWKATYIAPLDYVMFDTGEGPGINGGMPKRMGPKPADGAAVNAYVCSIGVDSVDTYEKRALDAGATIALPKMAIPGIGWQVYIKDPDGNILGLHQPDPQAK
jgi:uncharacterized protein